MWSVTAPPYSSCPPVTYSSSPLTIAAQKVKHRLSYIIRVPWRLRGSDCQLPSIFGQAVVVQHRGNRVHLDMPLPAPGCMSSQPTWLWHRCRLVLNPWRTAPVGDVDDVSATAIQTANACERKKEPEVDGELLSQSATVESCHPPGRKIAALFTGYDAAQPAALRKGT